MTFKSIKPGDMVISQGRIWRVSGCYLGVLGCEDIIGLEVVDKRQGSMDGRDVKEMAVPLALIPTDSVFRLVDRNHSPP